MRSEMIGRMVPENCRTATLLMRRVSGEFWFARIDSRLAAASRAAAVWAGSVQPLIVGEPTANLAADVDASHSVNPNSCRMNVYSMAVSR